MFQYNNSVQIKMNYVPIFVLFILYQNGEADYSTRWTDKPMYTVPANFQDKVSKR